jgi:sugar lactone lactonase YvrE
MELNRVDCILEAKAMLGEGALWSAAEQALWFVDIKRDTVHRLNTADGAHDMWPSPPRPGFIAPRRSGGFVVGTQAGLQDFDPVSGSFTRRTPIEADRPGNRINDGHVDAHGRLWFGTMDDAEKAPTGALYRLDARGLVRCDDGYAITNGPAFCPRSSRLFHTDTLGRVIYAFDVDAEGNLANKRIFAHVDPGNPDGMAVDAEGCVWSALYGGWGINRYAATGELLGHLAFPCANVTKLAFGGDDLRTIYATTAQWHMTEAALAEQPLAGGVFRVRVDVPGLPQALFDG